MMMKGLAAHFIQFFSSSSALMASVAVTMTHDGKGINTAHKTFFRTINQRDIGGSCVCVQAAFLTVIVPIGLRKISLRPNTPGPAGTKPMLGRPTQSPLHTPSRCIRPTKTAT